MSEHEEPQLLKNLQKKTGNVLESGGGGGDIMGNPDHVLNPVVNQPKVIRMKIWGLYIYISTTLWGAVSKKMWAILAVGLE